jgi:hypothetical protein
MNSNSNSNNSEKLRILKERDYKPHHFLIQAARVGLEQAEKVTDIDRKISNWTPYDLMAITFSAFALEAICNSFGKAFVERWKDFEYSSPIAKLRIICAKLEINPDFQQEPWSAALWLMAFRNDVAHARPDFIETDEIVPVNENNFWDIHNDPPSKIEKQINLENAKRAVKAIQEILDQFYLKIKPDERGNLFFDSFSGKTTSC